MESESSVPSNRPKKGKGKQPEGKEKQQRRLWTVKEEEALLACMLDVICDKYRADNGFKAGYFVLVEKELQKVLPGTTLKAQPNIESKVKNWKEKYGVIADALKLSGFAWNHATKSIEVDDESVWDAYEKGNPRAKGMNGKAFPMYESWQILFGKDRATGELAEDAADILEEEEDDPIDMSNQMFERDFYTPLFDNGEPVFTGGSGHTFVDQSQSSATAIPTTPTSNAVPKPPKKKSKVDAKEAAMHEAFGNFMNQSNVVMEKLADAVGFEKQLSERRSGVFRELMKLDLDMDERFVVNEKICQADERVDSFYGLPDEVKQSFARRVLDGKIYGNTPM